MLRPCHLEAVGFLHQETENIKFWPILRFFHKKLDHKENCNQTNERKKNNLIVQIMKIGENCEESCLSYTALDLVVWFERSEEVTYMIAKVIFLQSCIQVQYELKARNSNHPKIWSLSSKNLHKNRHKNWSFVQRQIVSSKNVSQ